MLIYRINQVILNHILHIKDLGNFKNKIYTHYNPLCIIGLISDIQYADLDEILSFNLNKRH